MMARHAVPIFHPGHSLFFQKGEAARYRIPNRSIVDWRWIIGPDRSADGTEAKQGRKDHAAHRQPHSFDGGASKSKNRRRGRLVASVGDQEVPASAYRHSTGLSTFGWSKHAERRWVGRPDGGRPDGGRNSF